MRKLQPEDTSKFSKGDGILTIRMDRSQPYPTGPCRRIINETKKDEKTFVVKKAA